MKDITTNSASAIYSSRPNGDLILDPSTSMILHTYVALPTDHSHVSDFVPCLRGLGYTRLMYAIVVIMGSLFVAPVVW